MKFDLPRHSQPIIKVIGVGGGGSNAVNHMYQQGIRGVDFLICNTDSQALENSKIPGKIQLGATLTEGRGAGSIPDVGKNAAIENINEIKDLLKDHTKMVFVTAGMGGGTGTGAAPVIAATAREMGILTVGIVTIPFTFEGKKRGKAAADGMEQLRQNVDTLLVISNDKLREIFGNLGITAAFAQADNVLTTAAKGIAEIITAPGQINTDFADVCTVMRDGGIALMGAGSADGADRAMRALKEALTSPLLNDNNIRGAKQILVNIAFGEDISMDEFGELMDFVQEEAGWEANIIMGTSIDQSLGGRVNVTLVATGIQSEEKEEPRVVMSMPVTEANTPQVPKNVISTGSTSEQAKETYHNGTRSENVRDVEVDRDIMITNADSREELQMTLVVKEEGKAEPGEEDEMRRLSRERLANIKNLSSKLKAPAPVSELEGTLAYERRNRKLSPVPNSAETNISRYTLNDNPEDKKVEIRPNNSFLHDNVD
ncbi:MAG: cell division protein FtsZ [Bacteroidia bacterium]|nr:cell division protein FtsZ [Bacteroidia bacterium]MCC6767880.1 cell division protein FtsZ [Bacteroidia bacterium]